MLGAQSQMSSARERAPNCTTQVWRTTRASPCMRRASPFDTCVPHADAHANARPCKRPLPHERAPWAPNMRTGARRPPRTRLQRTQAASGSSACMSRRR